MTRQILDTRQQSDIVNLLLVAATTLEVTAAQYVASGIGPTKGLRETANKCYALLALIRDASAVELVTLDK